MDNMGNAVQPLDVDAMSFEELKELERDGFIRLNSARDIAFTILEKIDAGATVAQVRELASELIIMIDAEEAP